MNKINLECYERAFWYFISAFRKGERKAQVRLTRENLCGRKFSARLRLKLDLQFLVISTYRSQYPRSSSVKCSVLTDKSLNFLSSTAPNTSFHLNHETLQLVCYHHRKFRSLLEKSSPEFLRVIQSGIKPSKYRRSRNMFIRNVKLVRKKGSNRRVVALIREKRKKKNGRDQSHDVNA